MPSVDTEVLLWKTHGLIGWAIKRVTGMPWGHAAMYLYPIRLTVERTLWWNKFWFKTGIRVTEGRRKCDEIWRLKRPPDETQYDKIVSYWVAELNNRRPYNVAKLLVKAIVIPLRKFFDRIGWVPFDAPILGDDCSTTVAEAFAAAGIKIVPWPTGRVAPGDFRLSELLEKAPQ